MWSYNIIYMCIQRYIYIYIQHFRQISGWRFPYSIFAASILIASWPGGPVAGSCPSRSCLMFSWSTPKDRKRILRWAKGSKGVWYDPLVVYYMGNYDDCCHGSWFMLNFNDHPFIYDDGRGSLWWLCDTSPWSFRPQMWRHLANGRRGFTLE